MPDVVWPAAAKRQPPKMKMGHNVRQSALPRRDVLFRRRADPHLTCLTSRQLPRRALRARRAGLPLCGRSGPDNVWQHLTLFIVCFIYNARRLPAFAKSVIVAVIPDPRAARSLRFSRFNFARTVDGYHPSKLVTLNRALRACAATELLNIKAALQPRAQRAYA